MEFKYQFLEKTFNSNLHPLSRATYRHIEALVVDWCEAGSPSDKPTLSELYGKIRTLLSRIAVQEIETSTIGRAVKDIKSMYDGTPRNPDLKNSKIVKLDPLVLPIEWNNPTANRMGVLDEIITQKNKHRIIRSLDYAARTLCQSPEYYSADRLRYIYWANHILNRLEATGFLDQVQGIHRDLDLWVLAKVFERRDLLGQDMDDLFAWLSHPPFMSYEDQNIYLRLVEQGKIPILRQGEFVTVTEDGSATGNDEYLNQWNPLERDVTDVDIWTDANAFKTPEGKFLVADGLFSFIKTRPSWLKDQLSHQTYLLPSQQLGLFMKWVDLAKDEDREKIIKKGWTTITWGSPHAYKLDLTDFPRSGAGL